MKCPKCGKPINKHIEEVLQNGYICHHCKNKILSLNELKISKSAVYKKYSKEFYISTLFPELKRIRYTVYCKPQKQEILANKISYDHLIEWLESGIRSVNEIPKCKICQKRPSLSKLHTCLDHTCMFRALNEINPMKINPGKTLKKIEQTLRERYGVSNINELDRIRTLKSQKLRKHWTSIEARFIRARSIFKKYKVYNIKQDPEIIRYLHNKFQIKPGMYEDLLKALFSYLKHHDSVQLIYPDSFEGFVFSLGDGKNTYKYKCNKCGTIFTKYSNPFQIVYKTLKYGVSPVKCPKCDVSRSQMEQMLIQELNLPNSFTISQNNRSLIHPYEIDIVIEKECPILGIDYNGLYYHSTAHLKQYSSSYEDFRKKHKRFIGVYEKKMMQIVKTKIPILIIDELSWASHKDIWMTKVYSYLNLRNHFVFINAKDTVVDIIDQTTAGKFIRSNLLSRPFETSDQYLGMFYRSELVAVMTFNLIKNLRAGDSELHIHSIVTKPYLYIVNLLYKFLTVIKSFNFKLIKLYLDLCQGIDKQMLDNLGFTFTEISPVDLYVWDSKAKQMFNLGHLQNIVSNDMEVIEFIYSQNRYDLVYFPGKAVFTVPIEKVKDLMLSDFEQVS